MKKKLSLLIGISFALLSAVTLVGCQDEAPVQEELAVRTVVELDENNYWKYINVSSSNDYDDEASVSYEIDGVLDFALYEDVIFLFDVIYYTDGQAEEDHQSYTMRIACNAGGDAAFETTSLGLTNVTVGKWLGVDGELVSLVNYHWKIHFKAVSGRVIYTA